MNIAVLVSGGGTNLQALIDSQNRGEIKNGKISCVISSNPEAYAIERAEKANIPSVVISRKDYSDSVSYSKAILEELNRQKAGYTCRLYDNTRQMRYRGLCLQNY